MSKDRYPLDGEGKYPDVESTPADQESDWIAKLRKELMLSKITHNFTFSRDEVIELLSGKIGVLPTPGDHIVESDKKVDIEALRRIANAAPRGRWSVWTSNSWRRVFADQRGRHVSVIEPTTQRDGHADLLFGAGVATYLESFPAEVALELLNELAAARAAHADLFGLLERAHRAIDLLLAQMVMAAPDFRVTQSVVWLDVVAVAEALGRKPS